MRIEKHDVYMRWRIQLPFQSVVEYAELPGG